jgi:hypothetical protein
MFLTTTARGKKRKNAISTSLRLKRSGETWRVNHELGGALEHLGGYLAGS